MRESPAESKDASDIWERHTKLTEAGGEEATQAPPSVLVVDDEPEVCGFLERVLTETGYEVMTCLSGQEALATLRERSFNVVITDLKMPGTDGLDVLRAAKELDRLCEVMVVTAYASVDSALQALKLGAYDYIPKPFHVEEIRLVVAKAMEKQALAQAAEEKEYYRHLSRIDGLTQVYNYRALYEMLAAELERSRRHMRSASVLMIDVDDLKIYNDTLGHPAGDALLKELARSLTGVVRNCDVVARYGGDEFLIILVETNKAEAMDAAHRLNHQLQEARFDRDDVFPRRRLTISIGVATYPVDAQEPAELVARADWALCQCKRLGGNVVRAAEP